MSYRQLFEEAIGQAPPSRVDLDRVIRRERRSARLRPVLAGVVLVAVAAGTAMAVTRTDESPVEVPADPLAGFPAYLEGTRVVAAESAEMADRTLELSFTPRTLDLRLFTRCESGDLGGELMAEFRVGEAVGGWPVCHNFDVAMLWGFQDWDEFWAASGIEAGQRVTVAVTLTQMLPINGGGEPPLPTEGTFALAVGEQVPFEEYEFPPRPEALPPLPEAPAGDVVLRSDPDDPNRPVQARFEWDAEAAGCEGDRAETMELWSQGPGRLRVSIDGVEVADHTWWDYQLVGYGVTVAQLCEEVSDGEEVTMTVEPEHMTGAWMVLSLARDG